MRIAQIAPIAERVPPKKYGGTERVIYALTEELVKMGHDVTLFASGDSLTSAKLVSVTPVSLREAKTKDIYGFNMPAMMNVGLAYSMQKQFDIIHDHNPHMDLPTANIAQTPVVMTWHGPYDNQTSQYFNMFSNVNLVSISKSQAAPAVGLNFAGNVYNGLHMDHYPFSAKAQDYLLYVGRIDSEKGTHLAIDAAVKAGRKLILAAKLDDMVPHIKSYYDRYVKPRLKKYSSQVKWIGEVNESERNELMKNAQALLHPVTWPEPFGLTMIESMSCGCPVIAFNIGSIPEVVENGKTGFVVNNLNEMVSAIGKLDQIDRLYCRQYSLSNFSATRMAQGYENVYKQILLKKAVKKESLWPLKQTTLENWALRPLNN
jgi:glycosyltransferase involved in cell wall biosynthesis